MRKVYIRTYGCQANKHDSEMVGAMLLGEGYTQVALPDEADVVLFNTCSVRKHAEDRVFGKVGLLKYIKEQYPKVIFGIIGCMAEAQKENIFRKLPHVDFICGPGDLDRIPAIIEQVRDGSNHIMFLDGHSSGRIPGSPYKRRASLKAYVKIMEGCDNYCSYCVVPYVRGAERSRPSKEILDEIRCLIDGGTKEITLLGQNVNSYGRNLKEDIDFVRLLKKIDRISNGVRIRFVTSHPKDASVELFKAMRDLESLCKHLHLPVQSGSDRILRLMKRDYTAKEYLKLVKDYRRFLPEGTLTTDIIVGFPSETEEDLKKTYNLMKDIEFDSAFIFKYSPRPYTEAQRLKDDVPKETKEKRHQLLLKLQKDISKRKCKKSPSS